MVFADAALDGWDYAVGDFYALALHTRGAAPSCPKFFGDSFRECSDGDAEVDEFEDDDAEVDGLEDNDDDDSDDLADLVKSLGDVELARDVRDSAWERSNDPWHGNGIDPWKTPGSTRASKGMSTDEFCRQFDHRARHLHCRKHTRLQRFRRRRYSMNCTPQRRALRCLGVLPPLCWRTRRHITQSPRATRRST